MPLIRLGTVIVAGILPLALVPVASRAQTYPTKPIRLVVPFPAAGAADLNARLIGGKMAERLGQSLVIDNRVGAGGVIGSEVVAKAAPDGYTLLYTTPSTHLALVYLSKNLPYDPVRDFTPIGTATESFAGVVANMSVPASNMGELIEYARRNPGKLTYSSAGVGTEFHLTGELLKRAANVDILHVPYKGAAQAMTDLIGGQISITLATLPSQLPAIKSGKIKLLGILNATRYPGYPDVPTVGEAVPGFEKLASWTGMFGPAALPRPVLQRLSGSLAEAVNSADVRDKLQETGQRGMVIPPEEFSVFIRKGLEAYAKAIQLTGLKAE
jgi:tripartite-type tricarboxylate transporter receptor subunit TctC